MQKYMKHKVKPTVRPLHRGVYFFLEIFFLWIYNVCVYAWVCMDVYS